MGRTEADRQEDALAAARKVARSVTDIFFDCGSISSMLMWSRRRRRDWYCADAQALLARSFVKLLNAVTPLRLVGRFRLLLKDLIEDLDRRLPKV